MSGFCPYETFSILTEVEVEDGLESAPHIGLDGVTVVKEVDEFSHFFDVSVGEVEGLIELWGDAVDVILGELVR